MAQGASNAARAGLTAARLARVPGCERGEAPDEVELLVPDDARAGVRVRTRCGTFAVRARRRHEALGLDPRREALLQGRAAAAGLAPRVVGSDPADATLVTEYVEGRTWTEADMASPRQLERLATRLAVLHALPPPDLPAFDPAATARRYRAAVRAYGPADAARLDAWMRDAEESAARIRSDARGVAIIHGDPTHLNVIETEPLVLIDWEYATLADPLLDLGCLFACYPQARRHAGELLRAAGLAARADGEMLAAAVRTYERLNALWERVVAGRPAGGAGDAESSH